MSSLKKVSKSSKINPKEVIKNRSYCDQMHDTLQEKGVNFFKPSEDGGDLNINHSYLTLPSNLTEISNKELGEYLNAFTQQKVYMRTLLGYAEMASEEARLEYMSASSELFTKLLSSKLSETAKEREVNSDPIVNPYYIEWLKYKNQVKLLNYNISSIEDIIFLISREVSRRGADFSEDSRNYNVQKG